MNRLDRTTEVEECQSTFSNAENIRQNSKLGILWKALLLLVAANG